MPIVLVTKERRLAASFSKSKATSATRSEEFWKGMSGPKTTSKSACTPSTDITPCTTIWTSYALAYSIAALLNNLFGKGKEPFWQQAYTNLVKFIILLHKIAYDYVTLFDVYESAISPDVLEKKIQDAERRLEERYFLLVSGPDYRTHFDGLKLFEFSLDESTEMYRAIDTPGARRFLQSKSIDCEYLSEAGFDKADPDRLEQLQAVKRWFYNDWRRIEPKLRTSIVEGISVFLSLFDDNPAVKRTFCPPPESYDPRANADFRFGAPLPSFSWLIESGKVCCLNFPTGMNPGLAKALGVMMKLDFERAVLNRAPVIEANKDKYFLRFSFCATSISTSRLLARTNRPATKSSSVSRVSPNAFPSSPPKALAH